MTRKDDKEAVIPLSDEGMKQLEVYFNNINLSIDLAKEIENKDKEIERLKNGYCELKVKCNNGECDCTNEEYDGMVEGNIKLSLEVDRLNNIIEELEKYILNHYIVGHTIQNASLDDIINKLKELKDKNE